MSEQDVVYLLTHLIMFACGFYFGFLTGKKYKELYFRRNPELPHFTARDMLAEIDDSDLWITFLRDCQIGKDEKIWLKINVVAPKILDGVIHDGRKV